MEGVCPRSVAVGAVQCWYRYFSPGSPVSWTRLHAAGVRSSGSRRSQRRRLRQNSDSCRSDPTGSLWPYGALPVWSNSYSGSSRFAVSLPVGFHGSQAPRVRGSVGHPVAPVHSSTHVGLDVLSVSVCHLGLCGWCWSPAGQPSLILHVCHRRQKFRSVCHSLAHTPSASV